MIEVQQETMTTNPPPVIDSNAANLTVPNRRCWIILCRGGDLEANKWWQNAKGISQVRINYIEINFHSWIDRFPSRLNSDQSVATGLPGVTVFASRHFCPNCPNRTYNLCNGWRQMAILFRIHRYSMLINLCLP
jgi:hypothetical protein